MAALGARTPQGGALSADPLGDILRSSRVIAVLGAHTDPSRPACYVPDDLFAAGYQILPVNPALAGSSRWGQTFASKLTDLQRPVDGVEVFRRPDALAAHVDELLAMRPPPRWVWLQSGIREASFAARLREAGIEVVEDRCMLVERRARGLRAPNEEGA